VLVTEARQSSTDQRSVPDESQDDSRWVVHGSRTLYSSEWIKLFKTDVELPDGQRFEHHTVWMPSAAMTAVLNDDLTHVLLMWRHRFVPDLWNWELPGGLVDEGESPAEAAAREIEEETGYRPRGVEHLVTFEPMIGMVNAPHHVFIARGAERVGEPTEKTEMQRMEWIALAEVPKLIADGVISNSGSLVALLHVLAISGPNAPRRSQEGD
jgi:8-oxo-dGTP pyrophosphatase MutT (NUDIX family)